MTTLNLEAIGFYRQATGLIVDVDNGSGDTTVTANRADQVKVRGLSLVAAATATHIDTYKEARKLSVCLGFMTAIADRDLRAP